MMKFHKSMIFCRLYHEDVAVLRESMEVDGAREAEETDGTGKMDNLRVGPWPELTVTICRK